MVEISQNYEEVKRIVQGMRQVVGDMQGETKSIQGTTEMIATHMEGNTQRANEEAMNKLTADLTQGNTRLEEVGKQLDALAEQFADADAEGGQGLRNIAGAGSGGSFLGSVQ